MSGLSGVQEGSGRSCMTKLGRRGGWTIATVVGGDLGSTLLLLVGTERWAMMVVVAVLRRMSTESMGVRRRRTAATGGKTRPGLVIRDDLGSFVVARVVPVQGIVDPLIAKVLGVREALSWIKTKFPEVQTIEMDTLLVHNALQNDGVDNSYFGILIEECRVLARELPNLEFNWVKRLANQVIHTLAKAASSLHNIADWSHFSPLIIANILLADLMNE
ncbi:RNase H domain-containing protein [Abeliophyllum distichum]|uniref:RNase H domain-containing protein n=1 Tax=Abeliophyllum distichum TaxID=126358 RepID=A0ABD1SVS0_9LAMI